jgi:hypothetical protein
MRLFSWYGLAALATALGFGYVAGVNHRPMPAAPAPIPSIPSREEEASDPPPGYALLMPSAVAQEVIDLTCPPQVVLPLELLLQTSEPPLAGSHAPDAAIQRVTFEFPSGQESPPVMPYLDD